MTSEINTIEQSFMVLICQDETVFLDTVNRGVTSKLLASEQNKSLYLLLRKYFKHYKRLPTSEELVVFSNSADGITKEQKERAVLLYQEYLASEKPEISGDLCIDSIFQLYKRNAAKEVALRLADEKNQAFIDKTLEKMVADLTKIKNAGNKDEEIVDYRNTTDSRLKAYQAAKDRKNSGGLLYCFPTLNRITGGQDRGTLWIIRGGPKAGKSTALINMANHVVKTGKNVIYFTAEVSRAVIERRLDGLNCGLDINQIKAGRLDPEQEARYIDWLSNPDPRRGSFIIVDSGAMTTEYIRARMLDIMSKTEIAVVVVDYLSLLHMPYKMESNWLEVGEIAKTLRAFAKEFDVPILTAVQTNVRSGRTALSQEIENTTDLLMDISRENPDEDAISGAAVQINAKIVLSRDSGLGDFALDAQFAYSEMREVELAY